MADPLPPALLLDLDDTIVHFSAGRPNFWSQCYAALRGPEHPSVEAFARAVAHVAPRIWGDPATEGRWRLDMWNARRQVARLAFAELGSDDLALADRLGDAYTAAKEAAVAPFDGAVQALTELGSRGVRLGLVTNGHPDFQRAKLDRFDLERHFQAVLIEGEWGVGKPDASIFREALRRLDAAPHEAWMVGDNLRADIAGAQAVGIHAVWVDHAGQGPRADAHPERVVRALSELLALDGDRELDERA